MVSARTKVLITGILIIVGFFILNVILSSSLGITLAAGIPYVVITGILLIISSFLPETFAKICRHITYLILFVFILIIELQLLQPFVQISQVNITQCKSLFFPPVKEDVSDVIIDALGITSCILTGYFPQEYSILGWFTFLLFYIILPFVFIFALILSLMTDIFGQIIKSEGTIKVLSFVLAMYATRTMFGGFLLQFLGYSTWGLAGVFGAVFIVGGLKKIIEDWFKIEEYAKEIRGYYQLQKSQKQQYAELALGIVKELKKYVSAVKPTGTEADEIIKRDIEGYANRLKSITYFNSLTSDEQKIIETAIEQICTLVRADKYEKVNKVLDQLEEVLKMWKK